MVAVEKNNISEKSNLLGCKTLHPKEGYKQTELGLIPIDWNIGKVNEFCFKITDGSHFSPKALLEKTEFLIGNVKDMLKHDFNYSSCSNIGENDFETLIKNNCSPEIGDVLFSKDGTIGKTFVYKNLRKIVLLSSIAIIKTNINILNPNFLTEILKSSIFYNQIAGLLSGSALKRIVLRDLKNIILPLPAIEEQKKISTILTTWDNAIEKTEKLIETKTKLKKALMQQLLTGKKRFKEFIKSNEYKQTELGFIPVDWELIEISEIVKDNLYGPRFSSKLYNNKGNVKTIRGTDVTLSGKIKYENAPIAQLDNEIIKSHRLIKDDLVLITTAECGLPAIFEPQEIDFIPSAYMVRYRLDIEKIFSYFLHSVLFLKIIKEQVQSFVRKGTISNLPGSSFLKVKIMFPPNIEEQKKIASVLTSSDKEIELLAKKLETLKNQKKGLMQKLLTGQIRVKTDI